MYASRTGDWKQEQALVLAKWDSWNDFPGWCTAAGETNPSEMVRTARLTSLRSDLPVDMHGNTSCGNSQLPTPPSSSYETPAQPSEPSECSTSIPHRFPMGQAAPSKRTDRTLHNQRRERRTQPGSNNSSLRRPRTGRIERASKSTNAGSSFISRGKTASSFVRTLQRKLYASAVDSVAGQDLVSRNDAAQMGTTVTSSPRSIAGYQ